MFSQPTVSKIDGVISDKNIRKEIINHKMIKPLIGSSKTRLKKASELIYLGKSEGKMKGDIYGQNIIIEVNNGKSSQWKEFPVVTVYVVEDSNGIVQFAGMEYLK